MPEDKRVQGPAPVDALIVIGAQKGFLDRQPSLLPRLEALTRAFPSERTYWVAFRNKPGSLHERTGWSGMMGPPETEIPSSLAAAPERIFLHHNYNLPPKLLKSLTGFKKVALAGADTDACLYAAGFDLWKKNVQPFFVRSCCGSGRAETYNHFCLDFLFPRQFGKHCVVESICPSPRLPLARPARRPQSPDPER